GAGAGAAVAAVAVKAGWDLLRPSWSRRGVTARWLAYVLLGGTAAATIGPWLVLVLLACGVVELTIRRPRGDAAPGVRQVAVPLAVGAFTGSSIGSVAWVALKVGALSYGGGFVIIP